MRRVSKPWPPSDVYPDGPAQMSLRDAEKAYLAALPGVSNQPSFARSKYEDLDNRKLRPEMYREQRSLCIYCERQIAEGFPTPRIDHWYPLSRNPKLALHWSNLYLSCPKLETCDSAKGNHPFRWDDADMPRPVDLQYEDVVGFTSRGEIYVRSDVTLPDAIRPAIELAIAGRTDGDRMRRSVVNLNDPALVKARSAAVRGERKRLGKDFENKTVTDERAAQLLGRRQLPEFVSIRVASLKKTLGRGR